MIKVVAYIRCSPTASRASVRFRITLANRVDATHTSRIFIAPNDFDKSTQSYKKKANVSSKVRLEFNRQLLERKELLIEIYQSANMNEILSSVWFNGRVDEQLKKLSKQLSLLLIPSKKLLSLSQIKHLTLPKLLMISLKGIKYQRLGKRILG